MKINKIFPLLVISFLFTLNIEAQLYVTDNPLTKSSNTNIKIKKVEIYKDKTKVLVEIPTERRSKKVFSISDRMILFDVNNSVFDNINLSRQLNDLLEAFTMPNFNYEQLTMLSNNAVLYDKYQEKKKDIEAWNNSLRKFLGNGEMWAERGCFINSLENIQLNAIYPLKSKSDMSYNIWMVFPKIPEGIEEISIAELTKNGWVWEGVNIVNPDNSKKITEVDIRETWKKRGVDLHEGIYEKISTPNKYKLAIFKVDNTDNLINSEYQIIYLSGGLNWWKEGSKMAILSRTASNSLFKTQWFQPNKLIIEEPIINLKDNSMSVFWTEKNEEDLYLKLFPLNNNDAIKNNNLIVSGTGFAISSKGYIATNYHVIDGVNDIKILGVNGNFDISYNAKIVVSDKNNDLAILRIEDDKFKGSLRELTYSVSYNTAKTGQEVFTLGYPLRASMGDEIKLTNGIISSKSGFQGDISSYQVSVPIQPGNSGGPLFDKSGNLLGVINSKLTKAENASYAIKTNYLFNLIDSIDDDILEQSSSELNTLNLQEQVELIKNFVYIIECK